MAGEVFAAFYDADRLAWRPSREQARQEEQLAARRRERGAVSAPRGPAAE